MDSVVTEADVVNRYGSRYSQGQQPANTHTPQSLRSAIASIPGKAGNAIRALIDGGLVKIHTAAEIPARILGDAFYSQAEGAQSEYEVQPETARNRTIDGAELRALRRAAAGIEAPGRGITFTVADDGRAIVTGPPRVKVPTRFQRFADEHGLTLVVRRSGEAYANANAAMPLDYREAGALYFGEMPGRITYDRTGKTRFSADRGRIRAYVDPQDGTVHIIADNIPQDWTASQIEGLVKHEVAVHVMHLGKSDAEFQKILKAADGMRQMGNKAMQAAFARVPEDTKPEHVLEEGLAYYIEAHPKSTFTQRVRAWFRKALRKVGAAFAGSERFRVFAWANSLTENDLIQMAHDALLAADTTVIANNRSGTTVIDYGNKQDGAAVLASMFDAPLEEAKRQYAEVEKAYGGETAWEKAKADGKTKLNYRQWVQVRTPLFKAWFGDWEAAANATASRAARTLDQARELATKFVNQPIENLSTKLRATVSNGNLGKMTSGSATLKSSNAVDHALAVANLDQLFRHALLNTSHADRKGEPTIKAIRRYVAPMIGHDGNVVMVKMTVKETTGPNEPNPLYSVESIDVEKPALDAPQSGIERGIENRQPPQAGLTESVRRLLDRVKAGASKVIDPVTKEPMVVYHGTYSDFSEFDPSRAGENGISSARYAIEFTSDPYVASHYAGASSQYEDLGHDAGNVMPVFIKVDNPFIVTKAIHAGITMWRMEFLTR
ncbi:MAG: hypothetical protein J0M01_15280 [Dechloromonas sp.]|nr:hypothetical protein [Dechloromonas sp.]